MADALPPELVDGAADGAGPTTDLPTTDLPATVVMFVPSSPERWLLSVRSVLRSTDLPVVVGVLYPVHGKVFDEVDPRVSWGSVGSVSELVDTTFAATGGHVVVIDDAVVLPPDPFATAMAWIRDDLRVATVSFLSNAAGPLSFPVRNLPQTRPLDGHDEGSITRILRSVSPAAVPAPIAMATGSVVVLSAAALGAVGHLQAPSSARFDVAVADFSARARGKGFVDLCDTSTFVTRPSDVAMHPVDDPLTHDDMGWLLHRHRWMIGFLDAQAGSGESPFAAAFDVARVKVQGLRILLDGSCFGPHETGTQVATAQTIRALSALPDVACIGVALPGAVPSYAREVFGHPKVVALPAGTGLGSFGPCDIAFRPFQPVPGFDLDAWATAGHRFVVSLLDLIAYNNGSYFPSWGEWDRYRRTIDESARRADAVTVISADVATQIALHGLPIDAERVHVAALGTGHLRADAPTVYPAELQARGFSARQFALCLGVNYGHKNRELAMAAHAELRSRGFELDLVMAGPVVPYGSSRLAESQWSGPDSHVHVLPEVTEEERNWLLRHASLVWYPTSAEGFGFLPFEAAAFGVPTVAVGFGPISELADAGRLPGDDVPLLASSWTPTVLADLAQRLLGDPALAARHGEALVRAGHRYSWALHAEVLVQLFRDVLGLPRRSRYRS